MFCKNCGQQIDDKAAVCVHCGVAVNNGTSFCKHCGAQLPEGAIVCTQCGVAAEQPIVGNGIQKSKMVAGLLGIFLGAWGIHNFYLGFTSKAIIQIVVSVVTCGIGSLWGFIEGILILTGNINKDASGVPLKD